MCMLNQVIYLTVIEFCLCMYGFLGHDWGRNPELKYRNFFWKSVGKEDQGCQGRARKEKGGFFGFLPSLSLKKYVFLRESHPFSWGLYWRVTPLTFSKRFINPGAFRSSVFIICIFVQINVKMGNVTRELTCRILPCEGSAFPKEQRETGSIVITH